MCLSIPIAMKAGMTPELAVTMAIPFGLLGTVTVNIFKMVMTYFVHVADRYAEEGDARKIRLLAFVYLISRIAIECHSCYCHCIPGA